MILGSIILLIANFCVSCNLSEFGELERDDYCRIVSVNDTTNISSSVGIYCARVNEKDVYKFYYKTNNGGYKMLTIPADETYIIEDDTATPHYERYKHVSTKNNIFNFFLVDERICGEKVRYIYVPNGTIIQEYTLDLQK